MVGMVRKLTKTVVLSVGTIVLGAVCAVGAAGMYFKENSVKFYSQMRTEVQSISKSLESGIDQFNQTIDKVETLPGELKIEFDKHKQTFEDIAQKLEEQADQIGKQNPPLPSTGTGTTSEKLKQIAKQMLNNNFKPIINSNHYYNPKLASPSWGNKMKNVKYIGNHKFGIL